MEGASYWCHMCSQMVNPIMEAELKCPFCLGGFIEEMDSTSSTRLNQSNFTPDRTLSLWAPILLDMMGNPRSRRRVRRHLLEDNNAVDDDDDHENREMPPGEEREAELDRELDSIMRRTRRRRSSTAVLQLLHGSGAGVSTEPENNRRREREREREQERLLLINPFNQTIVLPGANGSSQFPNFGQHPLGSLGDYFVGPGLDLLLQHLAENDPNRHGTLPAQKEVVDALPTVEIKESLQCSICLDDFGVASEGKEMPCKHKFHKACLVPWLELHSSCPVCRFQLPSDGSKHDSDIGINNENSQGRGELRAIEEGSGSESGVTLPWPLSTFTSSASTSRRSSSFNQSSSSASSSCGPGATSGN